MHEATHKPASPVFHSRLSFCPLLEALKKNMQEGNQGIQKMYGQVVQEIESIPELLQPITDLSVIDPHTELIEELLSAIFPPTTANFMYGVAVPFTQEMLYASPVFQQMLMKPGSRFMQVPEEQVGLSLSQLKLYDAYGIILKKYLNYPAPDTHRSVYPYPDSKTGLTRYMEFRIDDRFIDVHPIGEMPAMPQSIMDPHHNHLLKMEELMQLVPLEQFMFDGLVVLRINDVTEQAIQAEIKNKLIAFDAYPSSTDFSALEAYIQSLMCIPGLSIGITPFFEINGHYVYSNLHNAHSLLFRHLHSMTEKDEISDYCKLLFRDNSRPMLIETISDQSLSDIQCLQQYNQEGARSLILCPLIKGKHLIGILEIMSVTPGQLRPDHISRLEPVTPLFALALEKSLEILNAEVAKVIKKKFTAVQPAVEWKFTEVSLDYIVHLPEHSLAHHAVGKIGFENVWPLYAAIDIRNSSTERSRSIQLDLVEQLQLAGQLIRKAQVLAPFPLLQEIEFKISRHIAAASDVLQSEEEIAINDFLKEQVRSLFIHLQTAEPTLKNDIEHYFSMLDPQLAVLYKHRKEYENSVTRINETLSRLIDKEQAAAQKLYPHYFERFITDGLEFNIYIGQSISPRKKFDEIYLHNLKMWQLTVLAKAARLTHKLEAELPHLLRSTQLILCHSQQLSITFRTEERKFDVDGAYNVRYEIVKKRIDKVHIKVSNERLTQPGTIAIVYTQAKDAEEYTEYIEFLQNQGLLKPGIEKHDLEELQGVSGLRALRVAVNFDDLPAENGSQFSSAAALQQKLAKKQRG